MKKMMVVFLCVNDDCCRYVCFVGTVGIASSVVPTRMTRLWIRNRVTIVGEKGIRFLNVLSQEKMVHHLSMEFK
jgi:hypothetical protein